MHHTLTAGISNKLLLPFHGFFSVYQGYKARDKWIYFLDMPLCNRDINQIRTIQRRNIEQTSLNLLKTTLVKFPHLCFTN